MTSKATNNRNSTQKQQKPGVEEAVSLLILWDMPELESIFREQEISIRALKFLSDNEIVELIPKIGPRSIFRAMLSEWRQSQGYTQTQPSSPPLEKRRRICHNPYALSAGSQLPSAHFMEPPILKTEIVDDMDVSESAWLETQPDMYEDESVLDTTEGMSLRSGDPHSQQRQQRPGPSYEQDVMLSSENENTSASGQLDSNYTRNKTPLSFKNYEGERLNVFELLSQSCEGQCALDFYKLNQCLDVKNRKRVVHVLIRAVVERRINRYTAIFHDMTRQLLHLFPNEKYETYFVPHHGQNAARGALYYKYSNYTRQLRKDGLLEYKIHRTKPAY